MKANSNLKVLFILWGLVSTSHGGLLNQQHINCEAEHHATFSSVTYDFNCEIHLYVHGIRQMTLIEDIFPGNKITSGDDFNAGCSYQAPRDAPCIDMEGLAPKGAVEALNFCKQGRSLITNADQIKAEADQVVFATDQQTIRMGLKYYEYEKDGVQQLQHRPITSGFEVCSGSQTLIADQTVLCHTNQDIEEHNAVRKWMICEWTFRPQKPSQLAIFIQVEVIGKEGKWNLTTPDGRIHRGLNVSRSCYYFDLKPLNCDRYQDPEKRCTTYTKITEWPPVITVATQKWNLDGFSEKQLAFKVDYQFLECQSRKTPTKPIGVIPLPVRNPCDGISACNNGGTCQPISSLEYKCKCTKGYRDLHCNTKVEGSESSSSDSADDSGGESEEVSQVTDAPAPSNNNDDDEGGHVNVIAIILGVLLFISLLLNLLQCYVYWFDASDDDAESKRAVSIEFQLNTSLNDVQTSQNEYVPEGSNGVVNPYAMATQDYGSCIVTSQQDTDQPQLIVPNYDDDPMYSSVVEEEGDQEFELKNNPIYSEASY